MLNRYLHIYGRWVVILFFFWGAVLVDQKYSCYQVNESFTVMNPVVEPEKTVWIRSVSSLASLRPGRSVVQFDWYLPWGEEGKKEVVALFGRVVALEGDKVEIRKGQVYVNDELLEVSYVKTVAENDTFAPFVVPRGCVYVLADSRTAAAAYALDSRSLGPIPFYLINGVVD